MEQKGLLSVIVPVYKVEAYLRRCIDSIRNQTYKPLQIILVDDGSPDGCGKICDDYTRLDDRIIAVHQENEGLSGARNNGLLFAKGEYIAFVDSDDWLHPEMYERLITLIEEHDLDMARCSVIGSDGTKEEAILPHKKGLEISLLPARMFLNCILQNFFAKLFGMPSISGILSSIFYRPNAAIHRIITCRAATYTAVNDDDYR